MKQVTINANAVRYTYKAGFVLRQTKKESKYAITLSDKGAFLSSNDGIENKRVGYYYPELDKCIIHGLGYSLLKLEI